MCLFSQWYDWKFLNVLLITLASTFLKESIAAEACGKRPSRPLFAELRQLYRYQFVRLWHEAIVRLNQEPPALKADALQYENHAHLSATWGDCNAGLWTLTQYLFLFYLEKFKPILHKHLRAKLYFSHSHLLLYHSISFFLLPCLSFVLSLSLFPCPPVSPPRRKDEVHATLT